MYEVMTVTGDRELRHFIAVQHLLYDHRPAAIPLPDFEVRRLLDANRNPALQKRTSHLLVVLRHGKAVGRCSVVLPRNGDERIALLGFFECTDDARAADLLLRYAEGICRRAGASAVHGPFNPTTSGVTGVQLDAFDQPTVLHEACSHPWYASMFETAGYVVERRGRTWCNMQLRSDMEALAQRLPERPTRFRLREIGLRELQEGIGDLAAIFDAAFAESWGREPIQLDEYFFAARFLLPAWRPGCFTLVYDGPHPVGALLCFPDINPAFRYTTHVPRLLTLWRARQLSRRSRSLVTFAMGLHPDYQNSAAGLLLSRHAAALGQRYDRMYSTWITEGNTASERMATRFGLSPWKTFAVYRKDFRPSSHTENVQPNTERRHP
ncbi:MAG: hypothetical protein JXA28_10135 [Bacteroidetes bacterium]|nr:hypothetical protein [Bacteroidota bacterium]